MFVLHTASGSRRRLSVLGFFRESHGHALTVIRACGSAGAWGILGIWRARTLSMVAECLSVGAWSVLGISRASRSAEA